MKIRITQIKPCLILFIVLNTIIFLTVYMISKQNNVSTDNKIHYTKNTYTYKIVDNCKIRADVYRYSDEKVRPVIVWIHGGALIFGIRNWLPFEQLEMYLKKGYTVVAIDYRLAPETKLTEIIEDIEDAYAWVRIKGPDLFKVDSERIVVVGNSAGGYLTLVAGFRLKPKPRALVSFYGYGDITGAWYARPDPFYSQEPTISKDQAYAAIGSSVISAASMRDRKQFYIYCRQKGLWPREISGHDPKNERTWFSAYEPLCNVTSTYPPTILLHGEKDTDVPFVQSVLMAEALKRHGVDFELITNPKWGHGFDFSGMKDPTIKEAFDRVLTFLDKHISL